MNSKKKQNELELKLLQYNLAIEAAKSQVIFIQRKPQKIMPAEAVLLQDILGDSIYAEKKKAA